LPNACNRANTLPRYSFFTVQKLLGHKE